MLGCDRNPARRRRPAAQRKRIPPDTHPMTGPRLPIDKMTDHRNLQTAELDIGKGSFQLQAKLAVTPLGLLSIAALVGTILLSTAAVVQAAKK
jgi:hypothetical protein